MFKLRCKTSTLIRVSLKNRKYIKKTKTIEILGCSIDEFKTHIESKFEPWMNWEIMVTLKMVYWR